MFDNRLEGFMYILLPSEEEIRVAVEEDISDKDSDKLSTVDGEYPICLFAHFVQLYIYLFTGCNKCTTFIN